MKASVPAGTVDDSTISRVMETLDRNAPGVVVIEAPGSRPGKFAGWRTFTGIQMTDTEMNRIRRFTSVEKLNLRNSEITDTGLAHIRGLVVLKQRGLSQTQITDVGLMHLLAFTNLQTLNLDVTGIRDNGLEHIKSISSL